MSRARLIGRLREYYEGSSEEAEHFRYGLLIFDIATILFIVVTSFTPRSLYIEIADVVIGVLILANFLARVRCAGGSAATILTTGALRGLKASSARRLVGLDANSVSTARLEARWAA